MIRRRRAAGSAGAAKLGAMIDRFGSRIVWDEDLRREFEKRNMVVVPAGFYHPVPTEAELAASFERDEQFPFASPAVFDPSVLRSELEALIPHAAEFAPPERGASPDEYGWKSGMIGYSDAMAYYAMIRSRKPELVLEVGSGFSTLIALEAIRANGHGRIVCVEPYPRDFLHDLDRERVELVETPVQRLAPSWFAERLSAGSILFIDSTHAVKAGSDCLHLYLRVLPALAEAVCVHVHDVHLPRGTDPAWVERRLFWTEQYLLYAYLLGNPRTRVVFGSVANLHWNPDLMTTLMYGRAPAGGGSLWFEQAAAAGGDAASVS